MVKQFVEQLQRVVEAEASRAGTLCDDALQLQAPCGGGAHAARHDDRARRRAGWPGRGVTRTRRRVGLRIRGAKHTSRALGGAPRAASWSAYGCVMLACGGGGGSSGSGVFGDGRI